MAPTTPQGNVCHYCYIMRKGYRVVVTDNGTADIVPQGSSTASTRVTLDMPLEAFQAALSGLPNLSAHTEDQMRATCAHKRDAAEINEAPAARTELPDNLCMLCFLYRKGYRHESTPGKVCIVPVSYTAATLMHTYEFTRETSEDQVQQNILKLPILRADISRDDLFAVCRHFILAEQRDIPENNNGARQNTFRALWKVVPLEQRDDHPVMNLLRQLLPSVSSYSAAEAAAEALQAPPANAYVNPINYVRTAKYNQARKQQEYAQFYEENEEWRETTIRHLLTGRYPFARGQYQKQLKAEGQRRYNTDAAYRQQIDEERDHLQQQRRAAQQQQ